MTKPKQEVMRISSNSRLTILYDIAAEVRRAEGAFPKWPIEPLFGAGIVAEEAGEVAKAAVDLQWGRGDAGKLRKELVHTAAMCVRQIAMLDRPKHEAAEEKKDGKPK